MCDLHGGGGFCVSSELCLDGLDLLDEEVAVQTEFRHLCLQTIRTCRYKQNRFSWGTNLLGSFAFLNSYKMLTCCLLEFSKVCVHLGVFKAWQQWTNKCTFVFVPVQCSSFGRTQCYQPPLSLCSVHSSDVKVLLARDDQLQTRWVGWVDCNTDTVWMLTVL